ncbi:hypothetical protein TrVE_jg14245 [Triparma verrucosa]|uniref:Uncharacterized protein n=1 Tax=Triparma verrucosa TaxID=1606542 RepID=A0A9W7EZI1_9STRA|nr:hypothetical protein TrVE_jg14245 [Triparma verrucosa]
MSPDLAIAYALMCIAQNFGSEIVAILHGDEAKAAAMTGNNDVDPNAPLEDLCLAYESHHFSGLSNSLHAAGICLSILSFLSAITNIGSVGRLRNLAWVPPLYYLSAWAGHFFIQKDIPAVFSYGMSFRGWYAGEYCSMRAFFGWGDRGFVTLAEPWQFMATVALMAMWVIANNGSVAPCPSPIKVKSIKSKAA